MADHKLRVRIGDHEFEAEGSEESVERQFALWKEILATAAPKTPAPALASPPPAVILPPPLPQGGMATPEGLDRAFRRDGPIITLSVIPNGPNRDADAGLLVLLGHRLLLTEDNITGTRLLQGLNRSGVSVDRADRMFGDYMPQYVIRSGARKAVRYRLTNLGINKAQEVARELLALVL